MSRLAQVGIPGDLDQVLDTEAITVWDFVWAIVIVALSLLIAALTRRLVGRALRKFPDLPQNYKLLMASASGWFVIVVGVIYALGVLGVDLGPALIGLLLIAGIVFFAGRGLLENFSAGLVLQGTTMFVVGDQIETAAGTGTVLEITGRTLTIRTVDGKELNVPNTTVVNEPLTNLTKEGQRRSSLEVGVAYGTDLEEAKAALRRQRLGANSSSRNRGRKPSSPGSETTPSSSSFASGTNRPSSSSGERSTPLPARWRSNWPSAIL